MEYSSVVTCLYPTTHVVNLYQGIFFSLTNLTGELILKMILLIYEGIWRDADFKASLVNRIRELHLYR